MESNILDKTLDGYVSVLNSDFIIINILDDDNDVVGVVKVKNKAELKVLNLEIGRMLKLSEINGKYEVDIIRTQTFYSNLLVFNKSKTKDVKSLEKNNSIKNWFVPLYPNHTPIINANSHTFTPYEIAASINIGDLMGEIKNSNEQKSKNIKKTKNSI